VWLWTVTDAIGAVVIVAGLALGAWAVDSFRWSWLPGWAVDGVWLVPAAVGVYSLVELVVAPRWRYRVHRWEVTGDVVYTRKGWLSRTWQLVPVTRIQTVDHTQGWLERLFGLATLKIQTASHAGSSTIEGLPEEQARRLSEELAARAGELRDDAT
jgi:membrane protein YdbS with pleckstrin-like domain